MLDFSDITEVLELPGADEWQEMLLSELLSELAKAFSNVDRVWVCSALEDAHWDFEEALQQLQGRVRFKSNSPFLFTPHQRQWWASIKCAAGSCGTIDFRLET